VDKFLGLGDQEHLEKPPGVSREPVLAFKIPEDLRERFRDACPFHGDMSNVMRLMIYGYCEVVEGSLPAHTPFNEILGRYLPKTPGGGI
jgi:hypothetical protein